MNVIENRIPSKFYLSIPEDEVGTAEPTFQTQ